jgi:hypothetical protein
MTTSLTFAFILCLNKVSVHSQMSYNIISVDNMVLSASFNHRWALSRISVISDIGLSCCRTFRYLTKVQKICRVFRYRTEIFSDIRYLTLIFLRHPSSSFFSTLFFKFLHPIFCIKYWLALHGAINPIPPLPAIQSPPIWPKNSLLAVEI